MRAYRVRMRESKGNAEETARIEAAHTALMMRSLTSRLRVRGAWWLEYWA